jgi:hypothetical protein
LATPFSAIPGIFEVTLKWDHPLKSEGPRLGLTLIKSLVSGRPAGDYSHLTPSLCTGFSVQVRNIKPTVVEDLVTNQWHLTVHVGDKTGAMVSGWSV